MSRFALNPGLLTIFALAVVLAGPNLARAQQQQLQPLLDRLERLERDIRTLNVQIARGGTPAPLATSQEASPGTNEGPAIARLGARIDGLEADLRVATGSMEEVNYRLNQISDRLDKLVSDIDFRLTSLEGQSGTPSGNAMASTQPNIAAAPSPAGVQTIAPSPGSQSLGTVSVSEIEKVEQAKSAMASQPSPAAPTPAEPAPVNRPAPSAAPSPAPVTQASQVALPAGTPKEQYAYAFNLLRQTNYDQAEVALKAFIAAHEQDPLASNARYWLGETYYVRKAYKDAAQSFFEGYSKDPKGTKAPDSLLKLGMSLSGLGKTENACAAFEKVLADYPNAATTVKNAVARERERNSCP